MGLIEDDKSSNLAGFGSKKRRSYILNSALTAFLNFISLVSYLLEKILINYFTNKDDFSDSKLRNGIEMMTQTYFDTGYLDFKVLEVKSNLNENKEKLSINIEVSEGIQYKLGDVSFEGELGNISESELNNTVSMSKGDVFNRNLIITDIQSLTDLYADQGYAFVDVNPITSDFLDSVDINFDISLNKKTYLNRITITGNTRTQDEVIRREIGVSEGGLYSRSILKKSLINLSILRALFENII